MNLKSGSIDKFEQFSQFASLKEFNTHMEMWLAVHKHEFSKGELVGLKRLVRFAAKVPGVSNAKIGTILKAIHQEYEGNGISRSTFKRMVQKAIQLGIITVHETERKNGSQTSNLYVFNAFPKSEPPKEQQLNHPKETIIPLKTKNKDLKKRKETAPEENSPSVEPLSTDLDDTYTSDTVPTAFVQLVKNFFPSAKTIEEYWRMACIAAYRESCEDKTDKVLEIAIHSFKQMIGKLKSNTVRNPFAYYFGILSKKFNELYFEDLYEIEHGDGSAASPQ
ncbi:hypothetical protein [Bacillus sp. FJAT-27251]|uniref:hypothetical protein n=1 Tax=Bacillus sp. FJAT-27251 TaxID=1684142 RepID=UPI0006A75B68|nr:hypothetical protein [Bacillus sp. FJAT-27251]